MSTARTVIVIPGKPELQKTASIRQQRVAAYCRVSTEEEEQQSSYENQCKYYTDLIMNNPNWSMAGIFADEGISGTQAKKRDDFMRMVKICKKGKIDLILTKSISRFARNTVDCLHYTRLLKSWGVAVFFEEQNINTLQEDSEFLITIHGAFAQQEIETLSANVTWGVQQSMREGKTRIQYKKLYGYRRGADDKPEIIPEQAEVVKEIYARYLAGASLRMIQDWLIKNEIPNGKETAWTHAAIKGILTNEKYCGDVLMQKTYTTDCITHKAVKNRGERPMYLVQNNHEAIIDRETYDAVQTEVARRTALRSPSINAPTGLSCYTSKYALSDRVFCGECGTNYKRTTWSKNGKKRIVWRCVSRLDYGKKYCHDSPTVDEDRLQAAILAALNSAMSEKKVLINQIAGAMEIELLPALDNTMSIADINIRLAELEQAFQRLLAKAAGDFNSEFYTEDFRALAEEMAALKEKRKNIEAHHAGSEVDLRIKRAVEFMESSSAELIEWEESIIRQLVDWVKIISAEEILVCLHGGIESRQEMKTHLERHIMDDEAKSPLNYR